MIVSVATSARTCDNQQNVRPPDSEALIAARPFGSDVQDDSRESCNVSHALMLRDDGSCRTNIQTNSDKHPPGKHGSSKRRVPSGHVDNVNIVNSSAMLLCEADPSVRKRRKVTERAKSVCRTDEQHFDDFFAGSCQLTYVDTSNLIDNVLVASDTPESFDETRRRLQSRVTGYISSGRPPDP